MDEQTCRRLEEIVSLAVDAGVQTAEDGSRKNVTMAQIETVRYEKLLYFYCAIMDLKAKLKAD